MIFDALKERNSEIHSQLLLVPAIVRLSLEDAEILAQNAPLLTELGFEIEPYGEKEYIVRGVPAEMNLSDISPAMEEICEKLRTGRNVDPSSVRDEVLHTVACKAAIKAGWDTQRPELEKIVTAVLSGKVRYCPHGRPVSALISRKDLDKLFKRIV
jgi:DNA mismatch repair protein MutL